jgi:hypothetical protein
MDERNYREYWFMGYYGSSQREQPAKRAWTRDNLVD